jgi:hypothetical protein
MITRGVSPAGYVCVAIGLFSFDSYQEQGPRSGPMRLPFDKLRIPAAWYLPIYCMCFSGRSAEKRIPLEVKYRSEG